MPHKLNLRYGIAERRSTALQKIKEYDRRSSDYFKSKGITWNDLTPEDKKLWWTRAVDELIPLDITTKMTPEMAAVPAAANADPKSYRLQRAEYDKHLTIDMSILHTFLQGYEDSSKVCELMDKQLSTYWLCQRWGKGRW